MHILEGGTMRMADDVCQSLPEGECMAAGCCNFDWFMRAQLPRPEMTHEHGVQLLRRQGLCGRCRRALDPAAECPAFASTSARYACCSGEQIPGVWLIGGLGSRLGRLLAP